MTASTIKNPCSGLCNAPLRTDATCQACYRTVWEHEEWARCTDERRIEILKNCKGREDTVIEQLKKDLRLCEAVIFKLLGAGGDDSYLIELKELSPDYAGRLKSFIDVCNEGTEIKNPLDTK